MRTLGLAFCAILALPISLAAAQFDPAKTVYNKRYDQGLAAYQKGAFARAEAHLEAALAASLRFPEGTWEHGRVMSVLATTDHVHGRLDKAERLYKASGAFHRKHYSGTIDMILPVRGLGLLYLQKGLLDDAEPLLIEGLLWETQEVLTDPFGFADSTALMAEFSVLKGNKKEAEQFLKKAVQLYRDDPRSYSLIVIGAELMAAYPIVLYDLGEFYTKNGRREEAHPFYVRSIQAWATWREPVAKHPALLARLLDYEGRALKALYSYNRRKRERGLAARADLEYAFSTYARLYGEKDTRTIAAAVALKGLPKPPKKKKKSRPKRTSN